MLIRALRRSPDDLSFLRKEIPPLRESLPAIVSARRDAPPVRHVQEAEVVKLADAPDLGLSFCMFQGVAWRFMNQSGSKCL